MNTLDNLQLLSDSLRSGEYKQIFHRLRGKISNSEKFGYCPIGIACEIYINRNPNTSYWDELGSFVTKRIDKDGRSINIYSEHPDEIKMFFDLTITNIDKIMIMNDRNKESFDAIANYIDELIYIRRNYGRQN